MKHLKSVLYIFIAMMLVIVFASSVYANAIGDVSGNGTIGSEDARLALRYAVNLEKLTDEQIKAADVDGSVGVTASDARLILRVAVGLETLKVEHVHEFGAWQTERNSKRVATGRHYRECSCGEKVYANCSYGERVYDSITEPTCTKAATYHYKCTVCSGVKIGSVPALGHITTGAAATCLTPQLCPRCNATLVKALGHNTVAATCTKAAFCSRCNQVFGSALGHTAGAAATCTTDQTCIRCDYVYNKKLGHDFTVAKNVLGNGTTGFYCNRCGGCTDDKLDTYNKIVNSLKLGYGNTGKLVDGKYTYDNTVSFLSRSKMASTYTKLDFGSDFTKRLLEDGLDKDLKSTTENFSTIYPDRTYKYTLPISTNREKVSLLENSDVKNIAVSTVTSLTGKTLLNGFADTYTVGTGDNAKLQDTTAYKNVNINEKLIKVVISVNDEVYNNEGGKTGVKSLPKTSLTSLQKLTGLNIRDDAAEFGDTGEMTQSESGTGYSVSMTMKLKQIYSSGTVTFYFSAATLKPVAAVYYSSVKMTQDVSMNFNFGIEINGTVDPIVTNEQWAVYLFSGYFD